MTDQLYSLLASLAILLAAFGVGRPIVYLIDRRLDDPLAATTWSVFLGLIAAGAMLLLARSVGWLSAPLATGLVVAGDILAIVAFLCGLIGPRLTNGEESDRIELASAFRSTRGGGRSERIWILLATIACGAALIQALAPLTSEEALGGPFDRAQRLVVAQDYPDAAQAQSFVNLPMIWRYWALSVDGPVAASLVNWTLGLLLAAAAALLARPVVGPRWAAIVGSITLLLPCIHRAMPAPNDDLALALMTTLALVAWRRGAVELAGQAWFFLAGLLLGIAVTTEVVGLCFCLALAIVAMWMLATQREHRRMLIAGSLLTGLVALAVVLPSSSSITREIGLHFSGRSLIEPRLVTRFFVVALGPIPVAAVAGLLFARRLRGISLATMVLAGYGLTSLALFRFDRWWAPAAPLVAMLTAWVWMETRRFGRIERRVARVALWTLAAVSLIPICWECRDKLSVAMGLESRDDYLRRREPTYVAAQVISLLAKPETRLWSDDPRTFYCGCPVTCERPGAAAARDLPLLAERLRGVGYTHLLLSEPAPGEEDSVSEPDDARRLPLADYRHTDARGESRRYRLILLR